MRAYSNKTVSCLNGPASGLSASDYRDLQFQRNGKMRKLNATRGPSATANQFCNKFVELFVQSKYTLIENSDSSCSGQFAACGEGLRAGACLAYQFGFSTNNILLCNNLTKTFELDKQHEFALVPDKTPSNWCILDKFDHIDHFKCGIEFIKSAGLIRVSGEDIDDPWFKNVTCETFQDHLSKTVSSSVF
jgi:hypothetical protein